MVESFTLQPAVNTEGFAKGGSLLPVELIARNGVIQLGNTWQKCRHPGEIFRRLLKYYLSAILIRRVSGSITSIFMCNALSGKRVPAFSGHSTRHIFPL